MKKKFLACALLASAIPFTAAFGCSQDVKSIASIDKSESIGLVDYYTITYTDGTTSSFTVTNGKDGEDGQDGQNAALTVDDVYDFYKEINPDATKEEFIEKFLSIDGGSSQDDLTALSSLFRSGMKIYTVFRESVYVPYYRRDIEFDNYSIGSAVIYEIGESYSYIMTNYHMVFDSAATSEDKICYKAFAYMYGSEYEPVRKDSSNSYSDIIVDDDFALSCEYVGGSAECDVAILKVSTEELLEIYPYAEAVSVNTNYEVGQTVYALGNPDGAGLSLTRGIISVDLERVALSIDSTRYYYLLRTDADLDHGSSGGGLFNADGEFIALCNSGSDDVPSINFAIPASTAKAAADSILDVYLSGDTSGKGCRFYMGVTLSEENCRYVYDAETLGGKICADVTVAEPDSGSENPIGGKPAQVMGLKAGDIIRAFTLEGKEYSVNRMLDLSNFLMGVRKGDVVSVTYERNGAEVVSEPYTVTADDFVDI